MKKIILIIVLLSFATTVQAFTAKEVYELQEKCGNSAAAFFKKIYGSGYDTKGIYQSYESHYNKKLNKCFIKMIMITKDENDNTNSVMLELYDVQENNQYGLYYEGTEKTTCYFQDLGCKTKNQWLMIIKPLMTN